MEPKSIAQVLAEIIPAVTPERGWTEQDRAEFARELDWVFRAPLTEEELARAREELAKMRAELRSDEGSLVLFRVRLPKP